MTMFEQSTTLPAALSSGSDAVDPVGATLSRRRLLRIAAAAGGGAAVAAVAGPDVVSAGREYVVGHWQFLLAKPHSGAKQLTWVGGGAVVRRLGGGNDDYWKVDLDGVHGYLPAAGLLGSAWGGDEGIGATTSRDVTLYRMANGTSPIRVIPAGANVMRGLLYGNGFYNVSYRGWAAADAIVDTTTK